MFKAMTRPFVKRVLGINPNSGGKDSNLKKILVCLAFMTVDDRDDYGTLKQLTHQPQMCIDKFMSYLKLKNRRQKSYKLWTKTRLLCCLTF